ncbi:MAG: bifunctional riboflavin kinase/FAD synthetase [Bacillota bacterium]
MLITSKYDEIEDITPICVALGSFDGVHVGHQKLIEILKNCSKAYGAKSMLYTFNKHPRKLTMPGKPIYFITDNKKRAEILNGLSLDILFLEEFENVMGMSSEQFVKNILIEKFGVKCVVIGYNYRFGFKGEGNADDMSELGRKYGFKVEVVPAVEIDGHVVSSSLIRHIIRAGNVDKIQQYLGRDYSISGRVIYGKQNGTSMGIRTANLELREDMTLPHTGVYITETLVDGEYFKSLTNIGYNPTFDGEKLSVESHLIGYENELYNKEIEIFFIKRLRDEIRFSRIEDLVSQIRSDIKSRLDYIP